MSLTSTVHLFLSTVPFLALFIYFLIAAHNRPYVLLEALKNNIYYYNNNKYYYDNNRIEEVSLIPLTDMLIAMLGMLLFFFFLMIYLWFFVKRRRRLMKSYINNTTTGGDGDVQTVIGNVYYDKPKSCLGKIVDSFSYTDLAYVSYTYPPSTVVANAGNEQQHNQQYVEKKIRTYHPYHRENVAILILNGMPLSGQPKSDVERDVASFQSEYAIRNRDRINQVICICIFWTIFLLSSSIYLLKQIEVVDNLNIQAEGEVDDIDIAKKYFWIYLLGITPLVAVGGNVFQWIVYYRWITKGGKVVGILKHVIPNILHTKSNVDDEENGGSYVAMA